MRAPRTRRAVAAAAIVSAAAVVPVVASTPALAATTTFYRPANGVFQIAGHGFGHGHGMSQWGAYGGAETGRSYQQILDWYYASPAYGTSGGSIKVQITSDGKGSDGHYDAQVKPASGLRATDQAGHSLTLPAKDASTGATFDLFRAVLLSDGTFRVQGHEASGWLSLRATGASHVSDWTGWVRLSATGGVLDLVRSNGSTEYYRESLELDRTSGAAGITVNRLSLEHYLAGVVSSEMPCGWTPSVAGSKRLDALEAQAVAARSYAAWRRQHPRSSLVDIVDNTGDQAYHGYSAEKTALTDCPWTTSSGSKTSAEVAAVTATAGKVMVDDKRAPIFAQYSASNGGFETSGSQAYLPSRPDAWDGVPTESWNSHAWTDSFTAGQVQAAYPSVGTLSSIAIPGRESLSGTDQNGAKVAEQWGGRVTAMTLTGSGGSVSTTGASFASALGLMGPWFQVLVYKPSAPTSVTATPGDGQATVHWAAPSTDGGGGIRSYTITASPAITPVTVSGTARSAVIAGLSNGTSYVFSVTAANTAGKGAAASAAPVTPAVPVVASSYHAVAPYRVLDSRRGTGYSGPLGGHHSITLAVAGASGSPVPSGAAAVALNVTVTGPVRPGFLSVGPHLSTGTSNVNFAAGRTVANLVLSQLASAGTVTIYNGSTGTVQVVADVEGYSTADHSGATFHPQAPVRLVDSRTSTGFAGPLQPHSSVTVPVAGVGGSPVPSGASSVALNVTATGATSGGWLSVAPQLATGTSNLNFAPRQTVPNLVVTPLGSAGTVTIYNGSGGTVQVVADVEGYWTSDGSGRDYHAQSPHRVLDSRSGTGFTGPLHAHSAITLPVAGAAGSPVPSGASSVVLNVAVTGPAAAGYLSVGPQQSTDTSNLNFGVGQTVANLVVTQLAASGTVTIYNGSARDVQVVADTQGYFG